MEFRILGPLEVEEDGRQVPLGGEKQRALLALLLLSRGRPVSTDRLIDEVWSGEPPATAVKSVQVYVTRLRRALGDGRHHHAGSRLRARRCAGRARRRSLRRSSSTRRRGLRRRRQPSGCARRSRSFAARPLADLSLEPWAQVEIARLEERRLAALEARIDADLELGRTPRARRGAGGARRRASVPRAPARAAGGCALPFRPPSRCARRIPAGRRPVT